MKRQNQKNSARILNRPTMQVQEAKNLNTKIDNRTNKLHQLDTTAKTEHDMAKLFDIQAEITTIEGELITLSKSILDVYKQSSRNRDNYLLDIPEYKAAYIISLSALKTKAKGRAIKDENGKVTKFTPPCPISAKILRGTIAIVDIEDVIQETYTTALSYIQSNDIYMSVGQNDIPIFAGNSACISDIYNTAQNLLDSQDTRHSKRLFIPMYDDKGNEIEPKQYTQAMRAYNLSTETLEYSDIIQRLAIHLTEREKITLASILETKQELRKGFTARDGEKIRKYKDIDKTLAEIAVETDSSIQSVRTDIKNIRDKATKHIADYFSISLLFANKQR